MDKKLSGGNRLRAGERLEDLYDRIKQNLTEKGRVGCMFFFYKEDKKQEPKDAVVKILNNHKEAIAYARQYRMAISVVPAEDKGKIKSFIETLGVTTHDGKGSFDTADVACVLNVHLSTSLLSKQAPRAGDMIH